MTRASDITSIAVLRRALAFLALATTIGLCAAVVISYAITDGDLYPPSDVVRQILVAPVALASFVGAVLTFPIGWFKAVKWAIIASREVREDVSPSQYMFNRMNVVFLPGLLTPAGLVARFHFFDALKWLGSGVVLVLLTFAAAEFVTSNVT